MASAGNLISICNTAMTFFNNLKLLYAFGEKKISQRKATFYYSYFRRSFFERLGRPHKTWSIQFPFISINWQTWSFLRVFNCQVYQTQQQRRSEPTFEKISREGLAGEGGSCLPAYLLAPTRWVTQSVEDKLTPTPWVRDAVEHKNTAWVRNWKPSSHQQ